MKYAEKFKDPRWQKKRLKILARDKFTCQKCRDKESTLHIHHRYYEKGKEPWDYPDYAFITLCVDCHEDETLFRKNIEDNLIRGLRVFASWEDIDILQSSIGITDFAFPFSDIIRDISSVLANPILQEVVSLIIEQYFDTKGESTAKLLKTLGEHKTCTP